MGVTARKELITDWELMGMPRIGTFIKFNPRPTKGEWLPSPDPLKILPSRPKTKTKWLKPSR